MASKRVFLLERDRIEASAAASLIEQCGHQLASVAHSLDDAEKLSVEAVDFALLERDLGDGTDATPVAERLSAAGIPYAFIVRPGDRTDPSLFPGAAFLRKPLSAQTLGAALEPADAELAERRFEGNAEASQKAEASREAEIDLIKSKLQQTDMRAGPPPAAREKGG